MTRTPKRFLVGAALAAAIGAVPSGALAATPSPTVPRLSPAKAARLAYCHGHADAAIQGRLIALDGDLSLVNAASKLSSSDKQTFVTLITGDQSGLAQLKGTVDATSDPQTCHTDALTIVTGYRVYVLVGPKVRLTVAADDVQAAGGFLTSVSTKLQNAINAAKTNGKDVTSAQTALDDMNAKTTAALGAASPVPGQVLALDPSGYPANAATLKAARQSLGTARADLHAARQDAAQVITDLG